MVRRTIQYQDLQETKDAKLRSGSMHQTGFRPLHTNKTLTGYEIVWSNEPAPPPVPPRPITERALLEEIAKERNLVIV